MHPAQLATIALITGDRDALRERARQLLFELRYYQQRDASSSRAAILVVVDGEQWEAEFADEDRQSPEFKWLKFKHPCGVPGVLLNSAVNEIESDYFSILPIGAEVSTWFANKDALLAAAIESAAPLVAGHRGAGESRTSPIESHLSHVDDGFSSRIQLAWLQMMDLVPMANTILRRDWFRDHGGFSSLPALQRTFWWEYTLRVARVAPTPTVAIQPVPCQSWYRYRFTDEHAWPVDEAIRLIMQAHGEPHRSRPTDAQDLLPATGRLSESWPARLRQRLAALGAGQASRKPLKVTVLGDIDSAAHSQLGFYAFFEALRCEGLISWRGQFDAIAQPLDLIDCDLVIFVRVTSANGLSLMRWCAQSNISTAYAIDDNWFWQGREWKAFEDVFAPGKPKYDNFHAALALVDSVLVYNELLWQDIENVVNKTVFLPTCIDLDTFPRVASHDAGAAKIVIGFVGSERRETAPLEALAQVALARDEVVVFVMSHAIPASLQALPPDKIRFVRYQYNYAAYAAAVCAAAPAVLLAPAGRSRFEASKCPNKYLEITAAGAVGIYSNVDPYRAEVIDGKTGLLVGDEVADWVGALHRLLDNAGMRTDLASHAMDDVRKRFNLNAVLPKFLDALLGIVAVRSVRGERPRRIGLLVNDAQWAHLRDEFTLLASAVEPSAVRWCIVRISDGPISFESPTESHPSFTWLSISLEDAIEGPRLLEFRSRAGIDHWLLPPDFDARLRQCCLDSGVPIHDWPRADEANGSGGASRQDEVRYHTLQTWFASVLLRVLATERASPTFHAADSATTQTRRQ